MHHCYGGITEFLTSDQLLKRNLRLENTPRAVAIYFLDVHVHDRQYHIILVLHLLCDKPRFTEPLHIPSLIPFSRIQASCVIKSSLKWYPDSRDSSINGAIFSSLRSVMNRVFSKVGNWQRQQMFRYFSVFHIVGRFLCEYQLINDTIDTLILNLIVLVFPNQHAHLSMFFCIQAYLPKWKILPSTFWNPPIRAVWRVSTSEETPLNPFFGFFIFEISPDCQKLSSVVDGCELFWKVSFPTFWLINKCGMRMFMLIFENEIDK
jgi:hypothetical protein